MRRNHQASTWERNFQTERAIYAKALRQEQACSRHKDKNEQHTSKISEVSRKQIRTYEFYSTVIVNKWSF